MSRAAPGPLDYGLLVILAFIWGSAFFLSKIAVTDFAPLTITFVRQALATGLLVGVALIAGRNWFRPTRHDWLFIVICALTGTTIPFTLISWGVIVIDSGLAAILMGFMPLVILILAHFLTGDEKMTVPKILGVVVGIAGLAILFWPQLREGFGENIIRQIAVLGAAFSYAVNALSTKQLVRHRPVPLMAYISAVSVAIMAPLMFIQGGALPTQPATASILALITLGILPSAVAALIMFAIIERQGASFFGQINLLVPVAGVLLGALVLGERLEPNALIALAVIVSGLVIVRIGGRMRADRIVGPAP